MLNYDFLMVFGEVKIGDYRNIANKRCASSSAVVGMCIVCVVRVCFLLSVYVTLFACWYVQLCVSVLV